MSFWNFSKRLLGLVPGLGQVLTAIDLVGEVAEAIGGDAGKKINTGINMVTEGLGEAEDIRLSPEAEERLRMAQMRYQDRREQRDLADTQGGRNLAKAELASQDEYVRQTRPKLLRIYAWSFVCLCFLAVPLVVAAAVWGNLSREATDLITYVICWLIGTIGTTFAAMYRAYTGQRTAEKMAAVGMQPEGLLDKLAKFKGRS